MLVIGTFYFLMENALAFGIEKFVAVNIVKDRQVVEVYVEEDNEAINRFCEFVRSNFPPDAEVDEVKIEDYTGTEVRNICLSILYWINYLLICVLRFF